MSIGVKQNYPEVIPYRKKRITIALVWACIKLVCWQVATKAALAIVYLWICAEGLRTIIPAMAHKLSKIPAMRWMADYEELHSIDLAQVFAVFLVVASWTLSGKVMQILLMSPQDTIENRFVVVLGFAIVFVDAALFYAGMCQLNWGGTVFSVSAVLATTAYILVLLFVTYISAKLRQRVKELQ